MRAAIYQKFKDPISIATVADPTLTPSSVIIQVRATGICRSDWWGWQGNDPDMILPHVPGHELAGDVIEIGNSVNQWKTGDRVTLPFVCGCGSCPQCQEGHQQVCDNQFQPGFTAWGSFAEFVRIDYAEENLVRLPENMSYVNAASLGCRFITAFRALAHQANLAPAEWLTVHGCGGVGLSALLIGKAMGAKVIAVDISQKKLEFAKTLGADHCIQAGGNKNILTEIHDLTRGGAHVSIDALGLAETCIQSINSLRKRGRHVQIGLMEADKPFVALPVNRITGNELEIYGSHGMQAARYPEIFSLIQQRKLDPGRLVTDILNLKQGIEILTHMDSNPPLGIAVIENIVD